jgi:3-oxoacyl-[acyl-carrier protein] reductase
LKMEFEEKVVLITGASRGLGRELALAFAGQGAVVAAGFHHSKREAESLEKEIKSFGGRVMLVKLDVSRRKDVEKTISRVVKKFGRLDVLVNTAAIALKDDSLQAKEKDWEQILAINLKGVFECSRAIAEVMLKQKSGKIVNLSSLRGRLGGEAAMAYAASKAGVENLTKSLAKALAPFVNVNAVAPGKIDCGMGKINPREKAYWAKRNLLGRVGQAEEVVNAVLFLSSSRADFITGEILAVDGGAGLKEVF